MIDVNVLQYDKCLTFTILGALCCYCLLAGRDEVLRKDRRDDALA